MIFADGGIGKKKKSVTDTQTPKNPQRHPSMRWLRNWGAGRGEICSKI